MSEREAKYRPVYENLDTAYVNLAALLRYLRERGFTGSVHVELDEYDADVSLRAGEGPQVRETDHTTGRSSEGDEALHRLLVRAREPGGLVSVYREAEEAEVEVAEAEASAARAEAEEEGGAEEVGATEGGEWEDMVRVSGELIATVERALLSAGADFGAVFSAVRLSMGDDYSFLDPSAGRFDYENGTVYLRSHPSPATYVSGVSEAMRRVVDRIATGQRRATTRERVALELAILARRRQSQLARFKFTPLLDRIAGSRVL